MDSIGQKGVMKHLLWIVPIGMWLIPTPRQKALWFKEEMKMEKKYLAPEAEMILFRPVCDLAITWTDLNSGAGSSKPQEGAVASENDIIIKL